MIKKLTAILVILVFLIGLLPGVLAENNGNGKDKDVDDSIDVEEVDNQSVEDTDDTSVEDTVDEDAEDVDDEDLENTDDEEAEEDEEVVVVARERAREKINQAKQQVKNAKERYREAKENYLDTKAKINQLKQQIRECSEEQECELNRKMFRKESKTHLIHLSSVVLETLNKLVEKVESSDMDDDEKDEALADLEEQIAAVEEAQAFLTDLPEDVTQKDINDAVKTIRDVWQDTKPRIKVNVGRLIGAKLGNIVVKIEQLETKFTKISERLADQGYDVSELDAYLDEMNEKLASAQENWEAARELFQEAIISTEIQEAQELQQAARQELKDIREDIRNIVQEIRTVQEAGPSLETKDESAVEDELEEEEEETEDESELEDKSTVEDEFEEVEDEDETEDDVADGDGSEEKESADECEFDTDCDDDEVCTDGECEDLQEEEEA